MSLALTYHNKEFGIVCSDGRVCELFPDGHRAAKVGETARKFIILRANPGLALVGSSSISKWLDFSIYEAMRRYVEDFPEASFENIAGKIGPTVYEAQSAFGNLNGARSPRKSAGKIYEFLVGKFPKLFDSIDGSFLNLLGFDSERRCVRNRVFSCTGQSFDWWEHASGVTVSGDVDGDEGIVFGDKLLALVHRDPTPQAIATAMLSLAGEISAARPETIGPPYFFHIISHGGSIIEEQFRRALATNQSRAAQPVVNMSREMQARTA